MGGMGGGGGGGRERGRARALRTVNVASVNSTYCALIWRRPSASAVALSRMKPLAVSL